MSSPHRRRRSLPVEKDWEVTSSDRTNDELDRILLDNPPLFHETRRGRGRSIRSCRRTPAPCTPDAHPNARGAGCPLARPPCPHESALWVQFLIVPRERLVQIARVEPLGPSPPPEGAHGPPPS